MPDRLDQYRAMRDFEATPEPEGAPSATELPEVAPLAPGEPPRFVVQEHHATALHWDLRLEHEGTLASWAVPRGIPPDPRVNHLAVQTEDHPLEYLAFHGGIPEGSYGAGQMTIWDSGTYEPHKFDENEVMVTLHGERARGRYALFRTRERQWMIHRMDPPEDPSRELMPEDVRPMSASNGELPAPGEDGEFAYEVAWDGVRVVASVDGGRLRLCDADGREVTTTFPEVRPMGATMGTLPAVLDGEIVVFGNDGRLDPARLTNRRKATSDSAIRRLSRQSPATLVLYDLLWLDGHTTTALAYRDRRALLDRLDLKGPAWQTPACHLGDGAAFLEAVRAQGLPGVVAKRLDSAYEPGAVSRDWILVRA